MFFVSFIFTNADEYLKSERRRVSLSLLFSLFVFGVTLFTPVWGSKQFPTRCIEQNLPITVGGSRDDFATCLVYDPGSQLLISGGKTLSSDFGPANTAHGFLFAVNLEGDWVWGNYFMNLTSAVRSISGCQLSSDGQSLVVLATTQDQVVMAVVNATSGKVTNLYSLEDKASAASTTKPSYSTQGAILLDSNDSSDGRAYLYASFLKDNEQQLVKILKAVPDRTNEFPEIKYHFSFSTIEGTTDSTSRVLP